MKKMRLNAKKAVSIFLVVIMFSNILPQSFFQFFNINIKVEAANKYNIKIGDYIELGQYNNKAIKWRCIGEDEKGKLLLSDTILCKKSFDASYNGYSNTYRKKYGSNYWNGSALKLWLNSEGKINWGSRSIPSIGNIKGSNNYELEDGFMSNFTSEELKYVKQVTQKTYLNNYDYSLSDGGSSKFDFNANSSAADTFFKELSNAGNKWYQFTTEYFFVLGPEQLKMGCENLGKDYMAADSLYWLRLPCNTGMSYENVALFDTNKTIYHTNAYDSDCGVRVAFYYDEDPDEPDIDISSATLKDISLEKNSYFYVDDREETTFDGKLVFSEDTKELTKDEIKAVLSNIKWTITKENIAQFVRCYLDESAYDRTSKTVYFKVETEPKSLGEVEITAEYENVREGANKIKETSSVHIINLPQDTHDNDTSINEKFKNFYFNGGTRDVVNYLGADKNYPSYSFIIDNDSSAGAALTLIETDLIYRGYDGWKDFFTGETSVKAAKDTLAALIDSYYVDIEAFAQQENAEKYANLVVDAFQAYILRSGIKNLSTNVEIEFLEKAYNNKTVANYIYEHKFDKLMTYVLEECNISETSKVGQKLLKFNKSQELCNALSKGMSWFSNGVKIVSASYDLLMQVYQLDSMMRADEISFEMLKYLKENCRYSVVSEAAGELYSIYTQEINRLSGLYWWGVDTMAETTLSTVTAALITKFPPLAIISTGYAIGNVSANLIFNTSNDQELKDLMRIEVYAGSCLASYMVNNISDYVSVAFTEDTKAAVQSSKKLYYSMYMCWKMRKLQEETLQKFLSKQWGGKYGVLYSASTGVSSCLDIFEKNIFTKENIQEFIGYNIQCPVDVIVYKDNATQILKIEDGKGISGNKDGIHYYSNYNPINDDYSKYLTLPKNSNYRVELVGRNSGTVSTTIMTINSDGTVLSKSFYNIPVKEGTRIALNNNQNLDSYKVTDAPDRQDYSENLIESTKLEIAKNILPPEKTDKEDHSGNSTIIDEGLCGKDVFWELSANYTLRIFGKGIIEDFVPSETQPWYTYRDKIKKIEIDEGIRTIGQNAFLGVMASNIEIADSVEYIYKNAFYKCRNLRLESLPKNLLSINASAFSECDAITKINFPSSVYYVAPYAFNGCDNLETVNIPANLSDINRYNFWGCKNLKAINVDPNNQTYCSVDGVWFDKSMSIIYKYPAAKKEIRYVVPQTVTKTNFYAFEYNSHIQDVVLPEGLTNLEEATFKDCSSLKNINIPNTVTEIGTFTFANCDMLENLMFPRSLSKVDSGTIDSCDNLKSVEFLGDAPAKISNMISNQSHPLIVFYPKDNDSWDDVINKIDYSGTIIWKPKDESLLINNCEIRDNSDSTRYYSEKEHGLAIWVYDGNIRLEENVQYTVSYKNNINAGSATAIIKGINFYTGQITKTFVIRKADQTIEASASRNSIYDGETATITVNGKGSISYTSSDTSVATVDSKGVVKGISTGTARITVKASGDENYNEESTSISITVNKKEVSHTHSWNTVTITKTASCTLTGIKIFKCSCGATATEVIPSLGHAYDSTYTVDLPATIDKEGSQSQHCTRCSAKANIKVIPKVTSYIIYKGKTVTIPRSGKATAWKTSKKTYVKVTSAGVVTGLKTGSSIISCKIDGKDYKVKVVVKNCTISVNKSKLSLKKNTSFQLTAKATPNATVKWSSSKKSIAVVNNNGLVTAKKKGSCYIYVKANGITKKIKLSVK